MSAYLLRRLLYSALVLLGVLVVVFGLLYATGDPTPLLLPLGATREEMVKLRAQLGLDRPLYVQLIDYLSRAVRGDLGRSLRHDEPALRLVLERLPATVALSATAFIVMLAISVPFGTLAAVRKDTLLDTGATGVALLGQSLPTFWIGLMLIFIFGVRLGFLPTSGSGTLRHLVLPGVTLGAYSSGIATRMIRSALLEVLSQDYIRTARAKGLGNRTVLLKHALKNAAIPVVTVVGLQLGTLLGGALVTEQVFAYPGMARLAVQAVFFRDFPVVQAFVVVTAVLMISVNLLVDISYALLDPKIRYQ